MTNMDRNLMKVVSFDEKIDADNDWSVDAHDY
jgi:hypothetical protein